MGLTCLPIGFRIAFLDIGLDSGLACLDLGLPVFTWGLDSGFAGLHMGFDLELIGPTCHDLRLDSGLVGPHVVLDLVRDG